MEFLNTKKGYIVRLAKGEKLFATLVTFCKDQSIKSGWLTGIGGFLEAELAFYNLGKKEYELKKFELELEIASLIGNVSLVGGDPYLHIHTVVSDNNFVCYGGHLKEATVGATCEIFLSDFELEIARKFDNEIGLKLLTCRND